MVVHQRWEYWLIEWVMVFTVPKLAIIPTVKWLLDAIRATERQDEIDREWLAELDEQQRRRESGSGGSWGGGRRRHVRDDRRPRAPRRPRRPGGGTALRAMERRERVARELRGRPLRGRG